MIGTSSIHRWVQASIVIATVLLSGCVSGIKSTPVTQEVKDNNNVVIGRTCAGTSNSTSTGCPDGLIYFLPKRDLVLTVTVPATGAESAQIAAGDAYPDTRVSFVATIPRNHAGTVNTSISVSTVGLLNTDSSTNGTSGLTALLQAIGSAGGTFTAASSASTRPTNNKVCGKGQTFKIALATTMNPTTNTAIYDDTQTICGYTVTIAPIWKASEMPVKSAQATAVGKGYFYRLELPYLVTLQKPGTDQQVFVYSSPSESPTYFLPISGGAFGNNTSAVTFAHGVPTKYGQKLEGEVQGVLSAPATLLSAYFSAIGGVFGQKKGANEAEANYLKSINAESLERAKNEACKKTVNTSADLAAIKAACGS